MQQHIFTLGAEQTADTLDHQSVVVDHQQVDLFHKFLFRLTRVSA